MNNVKAVLPFFVLLLSIVTTSCSKGDSSNNLVTPVTPPLSTAAGSPTIKSVGPTAGGYGAIITITGTNFSADASEDSVWFNGKLATLLLAKTDTLRVAVPLSAGSGPITITVKGRTVTFPTFVYEKGWVVSTFAGGGSNGYVEGPALSATFIYPHAITVDAQDNVYFSDNASRIGKLTPDGHFTPFAGRATLSFKDTLGTFAAFSAPVGLSADAQGNIYVADRDNERIRKISPSGLVSTFVGSATYGYKDDTGTAAQFWEPVGTTVDWQGNVYVADKSNSRIRKITPGAVVSTLAGSGTWGFQDGPGSVAQFRDMYQLAADAEGNVYVADDYNHRIRKIAPTGEVSTFAGSGANSYRDGSAAQAEFSHPTGVAVDAQGNVYVADQSNQLIRKITPAGVVSTIAGRRETKGYIDGPAASALLYYPEAIAVDSKGNLYVTEIGNQRIRKISFE